MKGLGLFRFFPFIISTSNVTVYADRTAFADFLLGEFKEGFSIDINCCPNINL